MIKEIHNRLDFEEEEERLARRKKRKSKAKKLTLGKAPRGIVPLPNPDKKYHEIYKQGDNPLRFPKPFRCTILGGVNSGKSLIAKHILAAHQEKGQKFKELHIIHGITSERTKEYDITDPTSVMQEIPHYTMFNPDINTLLIFDDVDFTSLTGDDKKRMSELFRFGSTHCNISIILLHQSFFRVPKIVKDCCNVFIVFRPHDNDELNTIGRRVGLNKEKIQTVFNEHLPHWRDSLLINLIPNAPRKYSKNLEYDIPGFN
jgi:hypothetical protein